MITNANEEMRNLSTYGEEVFQNISIASNHVTELRISDIYISSRLYSLLMEYISYTMVCIALLGLPGNILIIITYTRIGFSDSINISYCGLGISDFLCVTCITWNAICFIPAFSQWNFPFVPTEIVIPTGGASTEIFCHITAMITAYISVERCLCVVFPFKVRRFVTRKRTMCVVITIFLVTMVPLFSFYFITYRFGWEISGKRNQSLLRVKRSTTPLADLVYTIYYYKKLILNFIPLFLIVICSVFLAVQLKASAKWRLGNSRNVGKEAGKSDKMADSTEDWKNGKDIKVAKTVLTIALAYLVLGTLSSVRLFVALVLPEFRPVGAYSRLYRLIARFSFILVEANSSVNFIIYYKIGTKFRKTFNDMVCQNYIKRP